VLAVNLKELRNVFYVFCFLDFFLFHWLKSSVGVDEIEPLSLIPVFSIVYDSTVCPEGWCRTNEFLSAKLKSLACGLVVLLIVQSTVNLCFFDSISGQNLFSERGYGLVELICCKVLGIINAESILIGVYGILVLYGCICTKL
jgi:hypothetical protein